MAAHPARPPSHLRVVPPPTAERASHEAHGASAERAQNGAAGPEVPTTLEALYRGYSPYVAAIGGRLLGRDGDVDDLVQDVFLHALKGVRTLRDAGAVRGWLATVTVRIARRKLRLRRLRAFLGFDEVDSREFGALVARGADAEQRALLSRVYAVLDELPVDARLAWTLRHVEGEEMSQVAVLCGCSLATAKRRVADAHARLEGALGRGQR